MAAAEQHDWAIRRAADDRMAVGLVQLNIFCLHHQACLGKKPALLGIPGLCSGLVRMTHSFRSSRFRDDFYETLDVFAGSIRQVKVLSLPEGADIWLQRNKVLLAMCSDDLSPEDAKYIFDFFTSDFMTDAAVHYCLPGCCLSERAFRAKRRKALVLAVGVFPDVPLLYRWKAFEPACCFALRGMLIHRMFLRLYRTMMNNRKNKIQADEYALWDEDDADLQPSEKQQVRMAKTIMMLQGVTYIVDLCKARMISAPLAEYMDELSLLETCRDRLFLRAMKFNVKSQGPTKPKDIVVMTLAFLTGEKGRKVVAGYAAMLKAKPDDKIWLPWLAGPGHLSFGRCCLMLIACVCDSWRRLVFRFDCFPWKILPIAPWLQFQQPDFQVKSLFGVLFSSSLGIQLMI